MTDTSGFQTLNINEVAAWPNLNPRMSFDEAALQELAESIRADGLLQPVAVAPAKLVKGGNMKYWLFAGERRLRACRLAGLETIDALVRDVDEATAHRLAGIENLDRNDLTAIEEAIWLAREMELTGLAQKGLAETLGRSQSWVANRVRLLELPAPIKTMIHEGTVAPAMARDTLLRFLKLEKKVQPALWKAIAKEIKREAKESSPVLLAALKGATSTALLGAGAQEISAGHHYVSTGEYKITLDQFGAFKEEHAGLCVQTKARYYDREATYTFAVDAWRVLVDKAIEGARSTRSTGGVSKKKLEKPKLSPTAKPVTIQALREKFGRDNVTLLAKVVDVSKVDPDHVAPVEVSDWESSGNKAGVELAYVGPNVRAMKGARTRRANAVRAEVTAAVQSKRMDDGADLKTAEIIRGLLGLVSSSYSDTLEQMLEAELGEELPDDFRHGHASEKLVAMKLPAKSIRRIAAGLARLSINDGRHGYYLREDVDKAVERRVTKDTAAERKAWITEHTKGAK